MLTIFLIDMSDIFWGIFDTNYLRVAYLQFIAEEIILHTFVRSMSFADLRLHESSTFSDCVLFLIFGEIEGEVHLFHIFKRYVAVDVEPTNYLESWIGFMQFI